MSTMVFPRTLLAAAAAAICTFTLPAHAVDLVAIGTVSSDQRDHSGQSGLLESGLPGDLLGGMGSGLAWAGGNTFLALPDRGPNATEWNASVDNTTSYIPRFHTIALDLLPARDTARNLPMTLSVSVNATTLLSSRSPLVYGAPVAGYTAVPAINSASRKYFTGRSDNFDPATLSASARDARFDPEGIRVSANGRFVFISDEYGPYLYQFHRDSGERVRAISLPAKLAVAHKSAQGAVEISGNTRGRVANKGMEGLAISPDGKMLFGFVQSPLIEDGGDGGRFNRIVAVNLETGQLAEYAYDNFLADKSKTYNSSELLALNEHELLVLERDGKGLGDNSVAVVKRIYKLDLAGAMDVSGLSGAAALAPHAVPKTLFLDIVSKLTQAGITTDLIPAKLEGMAFGDDIVVDGVTRHTLYVTNDNDYLSVAPGGKPNPNQFFVFTFTQQDLGGSAFVNQSLTGGVR
jgi:hypothetical protein